ncbi:MAG: alpha/beta fold hydrolase, partial [Burkholderiales bacterium]
DGWKRFLYALALATRAGEARLLEYELEIDEIVSSSPGLIDAGRIATRSAIRGVKRLTYGRRSNPWRQLMEMTLTEFPLEFAPGSRRVLALDPTYLVKQRVPLACVVGQQDQVAALADLASFVAYFTRLLLTIHIWSFRKPDAPDARYEPRRLPGAVEGLPEPRVVELAMPPTKRLGKGAVVRLTRYTPGATDKPPIVLIHGYSASGTTFAHHAVRPNLAEHLCNKGRDVWIVDLRTSSGMPTAREPWYFEEAALNDLPAAFERIRLETGREKIDVFAHCMGAAMFTMAVLAPPKGHEPFIEQRTELPNWIRKAVLSQIGPTVVMSPANLFRGYAMSYLRYLLPLGDYQFRVSGKPGVKDQLIDRLLATLPYPEEEFDVENPVWPCRRTPFVGTRHRMDALYGRDFNLANPDGSSRLDGKTLDYIDDLFGPLSIDTVSQGIHFARTNMITNHAGRNVYVVRKNLEERWTFPTMSIHGEKNGLADVATLERLKSLFRDLRGVHFRAEALEGFGHQDCLIGKDAEKNVFVKVSSFLE